MAVTPFASLCLVTTNFHVCIPTRETMHLEGLSILSMSAFPKAEGPECIGILLHRFLSNAGCKGSIRLLAWRNHVSEVIPQSSQKVNSSFHVQNSSSVPGTATRGLACIVSFYPHNHSERRWSIPISGCDKQGFKSFSNLLSKCGEEIQDEVWEYTSKEP